MSAAVDRLIAERACERLIIDYAALVDAADWEGVAALYSDDGRMSRPTAPDQFTAGREAILAGFLARQPRTTRHICANIRVTIISPVEALATSQILLFTAADVPPLVGSYADHMVDQGDGWRFAERRGFLDF